VEWEEAVSTAAGDLWYALLAGKEGKWEESLRRVALARWKVAEVMPDLERALHNNLGREVPSGQLKLLEN
jgi:hypothetical protein